MWANDLCVYKVRPLILALLPRHCLHIMGLYQPLPKVTQAFLHYWSTDACTTIHVKLPSMGGHCSLHPRLPYTWSVSVAILVTFIARCWLCDVGFVQAAWQQVSFIFHLSTCFHWLGYSLAPIPFNPVIHNHVNRGLASIDFLATLIFYHFLGADAALDVPHESSGKRKLTCLGVV